LTDAGRQAADRLLAQADVFVTNMRPAALRKLALAPEDVRARHPRLVFGWITGYGHESGLAEVASYDHGAYWAFSGMAATFADATGEPPQPPGGVGDRVAGAMLAGAIAAALLKRERTGLGDLVSTSLLSTGVWMLGSDVSDALSGSMRRFSDRRRTPYPTLNCFRASDGTWFWLQMMEPERRWGAFLDAIEAQWIDDDPRFRGGVRANLAQASEALVDILDEIFAQAPREHWESRLRAVDVPFAPVNTIEELVADPAAVAAGSLRPMTDSSGQALTIATPCRFDDAVAGMPSGAPTVGEHTLEILETLGYSPTEIRQLAADGAFGENYQNRSPVRGGS
jgi:crotonobetainyl-CoA:carnitine CoA-transferase CaiB-like acyl-CoA transferase